MTTPEAIKPADFPWFPYEGFTFSLGLSSGADVWVSGHTASRLDPAVGKMVVTGSMAEQARTAYDKVLTILEAAGLGAGDIVKVTENVTLAGLAEYAAVEQVRAEVLGDAAASVTTIVVERLVRSAALLEVEVHAGTGGGRVLVARSETADLDLWTSSPVVEAHQGTVYLPTIIPWQDGEVVHPGDLVGQYAWCLDRADQLLRRAGLSLDAAVTTYDYTTPETRSGYRKVHHVRQERLGGAGVYPGAGGIVMSRLHRPGVLVALDVTASRHPLEAVNPGWSRYDTLTYSPGVKAGRTLFMSGFAALDMETQQALHPGDIGAQAEVTYQALLDVLAAAGTGPEHLVQTLEFCAIEALRDYRAVAPVRERLLSPPWPASTGAICAGLLRPEFLLEVFATALLPEPGR